jgi:hypothetical protein
MALFFTTLQRCINNINCSFVESYAVIELGNSLEKKGGLFLVTGKRPQSAGYPLRNMNDKIQIVTPHTKKVFWNVPRHINENLEAL